MYVFIIKEKQAMDLSEEKEDHMGEVRGKKGEGEW